MDFILNPDIAYLILLGGILLGFMSVVTPGTGIFEAGTFICLVLVGYAVYNLDINWWALLLILVSILPFFFSFRNPKRELFLGLSILILVVGSIFLFAADGWKPAVNPLVALLGSGSVAVLLWFAVQKSVQAAAVRPMHDLSGLVGLKGEARTDVNDDGSVYVGGELWSARSEQKIEAGAHIRVVRREGFILVVEKEKSEIDKN